MERVKKSHQPQEEEGRVSGNDHHGKENKNYNYGSFATDTLTHVTSPFPAAKVLPPGPAKGLLIRAKAGPVVIYFDFQPCSIPPSSLEPSKLLISTF